MRPQRVKGEKGERAEGSERCGHRGEGGKDGDRCLASAHEKGLWLIKGSRAAREGRH